VVFSDGRANLNEGHGFSRAVDGVKAGRLQPLRYGLLRGNLCVNLSMEKNVPQWLKPSMAAAFYGTAKPVPFVEVRCMARLTPCSLLKQRLDVARLKSGPCRKQRFSQAMCLKYSERGQ
jgi:hypothetical protein